MEEKTDILAQRTKHIRPSPTMAITQKAADMRRMGRDVIGLGAGEPDFPTPPHIRAAAVEAMQRGETKYTAVGYMGAQASHSEEVRQGKRSLLRETLDYRTLRQEVRRCIHARHHVLLENLGSEILSLCLDKPNIQRVLVRLHKTLLSPEGEMCGVEMMQERRTY